MKYDKKQAEMDILKEIMDHMDVLGGKSLNEGLHKITVAAKDKVGLAEGLNKAKELVSSDKLSPDEIEEGDSTPDSPEEEAAEPDESKKTVLEKLIAARMKK